MGNRNGLVVLCVDDHVVLRGGLCVSLESCDPATHVLEVGSLGEAISSLHSDRVSVVLVELSVCGDNCADAISRLAYHSTVPVLVFSRHGSEGHVIPALLSGAVGFLRDVDEPEVFLDALRRAASGEYILDADTTRQVVIRMRELSRKPVTRELNKGALTRRELEILNLVCQGRTNRQAGLALGISESTVKNHMHSVFRRMHVTSRSQAATEAMRRGLVEL